MTIAECYNEFNGNYADVYSRLGKPALIERMLLRFPVSSGMDELPTALQDGRAQDAFRLIHTLKGVSMNLGLTDLAVSSSALTEALRGGSIGPECGELFEAVERDYEAVIRAIRKLG